MNKPVDLCLRQGKAQYPVNEVILHCAAISTAQFDGMRPFQVFSIINRWHVERGFSGFGYHGLFMPDGQFYAGRPFGMIGAHCIERNRGSLGFLMIESRKITKIGQFSDWFKKEQADSLWPLLRDLLAKGVTRVTGHNDYANKLCPGFHVEDFFDDYAPSDLMSLVWP